MTVADRIRARAYNALERVPGKVGNKLRGLNEALGRPLASAAELADRHAFHHKTTPPPAQPSTGGAKSGVAPVIVYHMEKQARDVPRLTEILDSNDIPYKVMNIQEDPAAQAAVRRDSKGLRLPVVFIAGECIGGRTELLNMLSDGELKRKVFGT